MQLNVIRRGVMFIAAFVLAITLLTPALAQRGFGRGGSFGGSRSFGGGSRSFGGGSFGGSRSSGSSFGGSRSSGGSFGSRSSGSFGGSRSFSGSSGSSSFGGSRSFSGGTTTAPRTGSSSFGRSGSFGSSGRVNSTSLNNRYAPTRSYNGSSYNYHSNVYIGGSYYPTYGGGFWSGYSIGLLSSPWYYHYNPFSPAFYVSRPYYADGAYYGGGFSFTRFIFGLIAIAFVIWLISRLFRGGRGGGGGNYNYTNYR